jgi:hypothetical protein
LVIPAIWLALHKKATQTSDASNWKTYTNRAFHYRLDYPTLYCIKQNDAACLERIPVHLSEFADGIAIKPVQTLIGDQMITSTQVTNTNFDAIDQINIITKSVARQEDLDTVIQDSLGQSCALEATFPTNVQEITQFTITIRGQKPLADYSPNAVSQRCPILRRNYRAFYDQSQQTAFIVSDATLLPGGSVFDHLVISNRPFAEIGLKNNPGKNTPRLTFYKRHIEDPDSSLDVDDPVISGFHDKTLEDNLNFSLEGLEISLNNWRRNPFYGERSIHARRCSPLVVNETIIRFTCTEQSWYGAKTDGPETQIYTLNSATGEWIGDASSFGSHVLTEKDFSGSGLSIRRPSSTQDTFSVVIHPSLLPYTFHVTSFMRNGSGKQGRIEVFKEGASSTTPIQVISLDPNMRFGDMVPVFFNVQDVNFDGFADIGVPNEGGAKWASYTYWIFDPKTGTFITTPVSKDLAKIGFNLISFDEQKKQITTTNMPGVSSERSVYQFREGRIHEVKDEELDVVDEHGSREFSGNPPLHCQLTITVYVKEKKYVTHKDFARACDDSMHTIPFRYPKERID